MPRHRFITHELWLLLCDYFQHVEKLPPHEAADKADAIDKYINQNHSGPPAPTGFGETD